MTKPQKLSLKQLEKLVSETVKRSGLKSSLLKESEDDKTVAFAKKVDKFFEDTMKKAKELAEEGNELVNPAEGRSFDKDRAERNRFTMTRVGFLKRLSSGLAASWEALKRDTV